MWKEQELLAPAPLSQNLEHTRTMVQNYTADLKHALWSLQSYSVLPPFLKYEWKHVLAGTAVNLDVVFSGLFSTLAEDKATASIGEFDLSVGGASPRNMSKPTVTGLLHGTPPSPQSCAPSCTVPWNCKSTPSTYFSFSVPFPTRIPRLSTWTRPSAGTLEKSSTLSSLISDGSDTSKPDTSKTTELAIRRVPAVTSRNSEL